MYNAPIVNEYLNDKAMAAGRGILRVGVIARKQNGDAVLSGSVD